MGVKIHKQKSSGDWYVWINHKGQRTSRKIGPDKRTAMKAATEYRKKLALGQVDFNNGRSVDNQNPMRDYTISPQFWRLSCTYELNPLKHVIPQIFNKTASKTKTLELAR